MINKLSTAKRYETADKLATAFTPVVGPKFCDLSKGTQFGIIINQQFSSKGKVTCLNNYYAEEIAMHLTNLVLQRLCRNNVIVEVDL
jgi:hypothetical protein